MVKKRETQIIKAAMMRVLRKIAGVRRIDHVRNDDIRAQLRHRKELWSRHTEREKFGRNR